MRIPGGARNILVLAAVAAIACAAQVGLNALEERGVVSSYVLLIVRYVGINVILAASLNLVNGVAGQFSIGHAGFMAVGAYGSAAITLACKDSLADAPAVAGQLVFLGSLVFGGLIAAGAGYLVGLPSLRLSGDYLAIVTLGFGEIIRVVILNVDALGGPRGLPGIPGYATVGWIWGLALLTLVILRRITASDYGRTLLAIREDEVAASAMGIDTTSRKIGAFTIAAFFAGVGGGLFAHTLAYLNPNSFTFVKSFEIVVMVILGGMGSLTGSLLAATMLTVLLELLRPTTLSRGLDAVGLDALSQWVREHDLRLSIYALLLILMMILRPHGLLGSREIGDLRPVRWLRSRMRRREASA